MKKDRDRCRHGWRPVSSKSTKLVLYWTFVLFFGCHQIKASSFVAAFAVVTTPIRTSQSRIPRQIVRSENAASIDLSILCANSASDEEIIDTTTLSSFLQDDLTNIGLTLEQVLAVTRRLESSTKVTPLPKQIQSNLNWLQERFSRAQTASLILGLPSILGYDIDTNLAPTVAFYSEALLLNFNDGNMTGDTSYTADNDTRLDPPVTHFLSDAPGLLEYNVHKRLRPRLERLIEAYREQSAFVEFQLDEDMLRALATKTDLRFEEWLESLFVAEEDRSNQSQQHPKNQPQSQSPLFTPTCYMVLSNLQSGGNIGNIIRSASIFGCHECLVVGQSRYRLTGDHGSRFDLPQKHVWSHEEAREYLHQRKVCIYGIEILEGAAPIMTYNATTGVVDFPFDNCTENGAGAAFVMGNEGQGLSVKQREICDAFIYIPQIRGGFGSYAGGSGGGSASLNVACAATVVLQAYALWASYPTAKRNGEKFVAK